MCARAAQPPSVGKISLSGRFEIEGVGVRGGGGSGGGGGRDGMPRCREEPSELGGAWLVSGAERIPVWQE